MIASRPDDGLKESQLVAGKLKAFPFTRYGTIPGYLESVGSDAVKDEKLGLVHSVHIRSNFSRKYKEDSIKLRAGLDTTSSISTSASGIQSYLIIFITKAIWGVSGGIGCG